MIPTIFWITCITLVLVAISAEAWLPHQTLQRLHQQRLQRRRQKRLNKRSVNGESEELNDESIEEERRLLSLLPWWEDSWSESFLNSFPLSSTSASAMTDVDDDDLAHYLKPKPNPKAQVLHFCFLQHGHRSYSSDLAYLQQVMQHYSEAEKERRYSDNSTSTTSKNPSVQHDMIVHCPTCNEGKTQDGVVKGGERMVQEILQVIRQELQRRELDPNCEEIQDITISVVGNSLGGIYGRYAIAKLAQLAGDQESHPELTPANKATTSKATPNNKHSKSMEDDDDESVFPSVVLLDGKYRLHFNIFCTTASPHLGISKHTYVPLPRTAEIGAAYILGDTGRDLFRLNDLMKTMATCPTFLEPLGKFRKRVAYANAYATDFPVPASTAAFLSDHSTYPHHFDDTKTISSSNEDAMVDANESNTTAIEGSTNGTTVEREKGYVLATLHTEPGQRTSSKPPKSISSSSSEEEDDEAAMFENDLLEMSNALDSLGWKKVFIDVRKEIPIRVSIPKSLDLRKPLSLSKSMLLAPTSRLRQRYASLASALSDGNTKIFSHSQPDDAANKLTGDIDTATTSVGDSDMTTSESEDETATPPVSGIHKLREKGVVESRDVASVISTPEDMRLHFPLGHNLMVALSRQGLSGKMYKGGRPVVDALAKELVQDIFDWDLEQESQEAAEQTLLMTASST